jgi:hypothetical protein
MSSPVQPTANLPASPPRQFASLFVGNKSWPPPHLIVTSAPSAFKPANYTFSLVIMRITNTRSSEKDSDKASVSIAVGGGNPVTVTSDLGNLGDGTYPLHLAVGPVAVDDPNLGVAANYLIVNSGHSSWSTIDGVLTKAGDALASAGAKSATSAIGSAVGATIGTAALPVIGTALGALAGWLVGEILGIVIADCDGPVAAEQPALKGIDLWNRTQVPGASFQHTTYHPGIDSNWGCGANSEYYVTWQIQRTE